MFFDVTWEFMPICAWLPRWEELCRIWHGLFASPCGWALTGAASRQGFDGADWDTLRSNRRALGAQAACPSVYSGFCGVSLPISFVSLPTSLVGSPISGVMSPTSLVSSFGLLVGLPETRVPAPGALVSLPISLVMLPGSLGLPPRWLIRVRFLPLRRPFLVNPSYGLHGRRFPP